MGPDQSKENQVKIIPVKNLEKQKDDIFSEEINIPLIESLILKDLLNEKYPEDLLLNSGNLPIAYENIKNYFYQLSYHLNKNEENLVLCTV